MRALLAGILLVVIAGCESGTDPQPPSVVGTYTYTGSVTGNPNMSAAGTLNFQNQSGGTAAVTHTIHFRQQGVVLFTFLTQVPGSATVTTDGSVSWRQQGTANDGVTTLGYDYKHDGVVSGNSIVGTWSITWADGSVDSGSFTAQR